MFKHLLAQRNSIFSIIFCLSIVHFLSHPASALVRWEQVEGTKIPIPPSDHPRLYLRNQHIGQLKTRLDHPALKPVIDRLQNLSRRNEVYKLELDSIRYLITRDEKLAKDTIKSTLKFLQKAELPDRNDACRVTGRYMVTGAIVYDWMYPHLTESDKKIFITELIRLAKTLECGYPPTRQGSVTGHSSEAMIMRDLLSAGIAIYDEYPEMYHLASKRFFSQHLPARNWLYNGRAYHQGDSYGPYRFSWDTFPLWIFDRMGAGNIYNPEQSQVPYLWIYKTRPDGQRLRAGDTFMHSTARGKPWGIGAGAMLTAGYYDDGVPLSHYLAQGGNRDGELFFEILWRDLELKPEPIEDLPLTRYFGFPFGWMVARTDWDDNSVIAEMKINEYNFGNHQHADAGAFQVYYKGPLAVDSGVYKGSSGQYGSTHCKNYYWRTIAHNSLLIYDPDEDFGESRGYGNDGGQRLPNNRREPSNLEILLDPANGYKTGNVLAHGFGPDPHTPEYTLLKGDITAAYSRKVKKAVRSFVFLNLLDEQTPAAFIVFDRVVSSNPAFKKYWLLHTMEKPDVTEKGIFVKRTEHGDNGCLVLNTLLPESKQRNTEIIGGPGKEYWVFGKNYTNDQPAGSLEKSSMELGSWRIQLSPKNPSSENLLLNVIQVTDADNVKTFPVERITSDPFTGCRINGDTCTWVVFFSTDGYKINRNFTLNIPGSGTCKILINDLSPGRWQAIGPGGQIVMLQVTAQSKSAWIKGEPGKWQLAKIKDQ